MTNISGELGGITLTSAGNPYYLVGDAVVSSGLTSIIQKDVIIKATGYYKITVKGIVQWSGAFLISNQATPKAGDWWGVDIQHWDDQSQIEECTIWHSTYPVILNEQGAVIP